jgi:hypothetical protein
MKKLILVVACAFAVGPAMAGEGGGYNPGMVVVNVYQNPAAGYGYGIGSGFGLPQDRTYRGASGYSDAAPVRSHHRHHDGNRRHSLIGQQ